MSSAKWRLFCLGPVCYARHGITDGTQDNADMAGDHVTDMTDGCANGSSVDLKILQGV